MAADKKEIEVKNLPQKELKEYTLKMDSKYGKKGDKIKVTDRAFEQIPKDEKILTKALKLKAENKFDGE